MSGNDFYDHITGLRALRSYRPEPLTDDDTELILEAARWTGSSKNSQNWSFVLVTSEEQRNRLADCGDFTDPVRNAPAVLALVQEPVGYEFDTGRVAQNVMLAAASIGVASCPITLHRDEDVRPVLGLPGDRRCRYAVALGYPTGDASPARAGGRKPRSEVVHHERYGGR